MARKPYDKGKPTPAQFDPATGTWLQKSWRGKGAAYRIDLQAHTCTCLQFTERLQGQAPCKHVLDVSRQAAWVAQVDAARRLTDAQLVVLLQRYQEKDRQDVCGAIRVVRHERRAQVTA